jgi:16S rRNA (cytosine1402-N4)-methyltransferase
VNQTWRISDTNQGFTMYSGAQEGGYLTKVTGHQPVLLEEVMALFSQSDVDPSLPSIIVDATFGGGGHTRAILERFPEAKVVGVDQDPAALSRAEDIIKNFQGRFRIEARNFSEMGNIQDTDLTGVLMDLGVSSFQLDETERGFSFRFDAPLDMRMNPQQGQSAADFLETASLREIETALRDYGEEPRWRKIANAIVEARGTGVLQRTGSFAKFVEQFASRPSPRRRRIHPATQTFQGIRIAINREIESLEAALPQAFEKLAPGGVLAVISFHSLEDRIVKRYFRKLAGRPEHRHDSRSQDQREVLAELLTRKPIAPDTEECEMNPRARSAKLRAVRKI